MAHTSNTNVEGAQNQGRLLVVDGHSLAFRAYFALPADSFSTSNGQATNAIYGFATMLAQVLHDEKPTHLAVAFDVKGGTFRNEMLPQYKGTRDAAPEDLLSQLPLIQELLHALDISYVEKPGFEGDDIIATLATMGANAGFETFVLSGDRDAFQLVDDRITVLYPGHHFKDLKHMTPEAVFEKYKVTPQQYPDLAAMRGETADNIPGVPGVGDGYAAKWIAEYGGLQGIIEHIDEIKGKKGEALRENIEQVKLNRKVNALVRDVEMNVTLDELKLHAPDAHAVDEIFTSLQFGARTKNRILSAMQAGVDSKGSVGEEALAQAGDPVGGNAHIETVTELATYAGSISDSGDEARLTDLAYLADVVRSWFDKYISQPHLPWSLVVVGKSQPGNSSAKTLVIRAGNEHGNSLVISATDVLENELMQQALEQAFAENASTVSVHGYKETLHMLAQLGLTLPQPARDTKLEGYVVEPDAGTKTATIEESTEYFLNVTADEKQEEKETIEQGAFDLGDDDAVDNGQSQLEQEKARNAALAYNAGCVLALAKHFEPIIAERNHASLLADIEIPTSTVLAQMESWGAAVNQTRLAEMITSFGADASQAQSIAWSIAGDEVNLKSPKQLQKVLFDDLGLAPTKKTKSGGYTTNAAALQEMYIRSVNNERANTFLGALLKYREVIKLQQIVESLSKAVNKRDGRIHTTFEQTVAATGRLSSTDPNLQNIPNRNAMGREIRGAFVPGKGFVSLLSSDYSQVELRIMAHLSGDEALIEAFKSGTDLHKYVASLVYQIPVEEVTGDQRSHIKAMSYGLAYGLSTYGLAQQLKISPAQADALKNKYFETFGKVHDYLESLVSEAKRKGYTETMFGRRRYFPDLRSTRRQARDAAERGALNAPIQGTAADIMKIAMIHAHNALQEANVKSRIVLQIHDELVVELAHGEEEQVTQLVRDSMEHAVVLAVPLDVSTGIGADWQQAAH